MITLGRSANSLQMPLKSAKDEALSRVNGIADEVRRKYITPIAGQEMIYLSKEQEAKDFLAQPQAPTDLTNYPFIANEIGSTGATALDVANTFAQMSAQWRVIGSVIEKLRILANVTIANATTIPQVEQAVSQYEYDMKEFG